MKNGNWKPISIGANSNYQNIYIQHEKIIRQLDWSTNQRGTLTLEMETIKKEIASLDANFEGNKKVIGELNGELKAKYSEQNQVNIDDLRRDLNYVQTNIAVNQRAINELDKRITEKNNLIRNSSIALEGIRTKLVQGKGSIQEIETARKGRRVDEEEKNLVLEQLSSKIEPAEKRLNELDDQYTDFLVVEENSQQTVNNAEKYFTQAQMEHLRKIETMDLLKTDRRRLRSGCVRLCRRRCRTDTLAI